MSKPEFFVRVMDWDNCSSITRVEANSKRLVLLDAVLDALVKVFGRKRVLDRLQLLGLSKEGRS